MSVQVGMVCTLDFFSGSGWSTVFGCAVILAAGGSGGGSAADVAGKGATLSQCL